jgi:hypothetical protein
MKNLGEVIMRERFGGSGAQPVQNVAKSIREQRGPEATPERYTVTITALVAEVQFDEETMSLTIRKEVMAGTPGAAAVKAGVHVEPPGYNALR